MCGENARESVKKGEAKNHAHPAPFSPSLIVEKTWESRNFFSPARLIIPPGVNAMDVSKSISFHFWRVIFYISRVGCDFHSGQQSRSHFPQTKPIFSLDSVLVSEALIVSRRCRQPEPKMLISALFISRSLCLFNKYIIHKSNVAEGTKATLWNFTQNNTQTRTLLLPSHYIQ